MLTTLVYFLAYLTIAAMLTSSLVLFVQATASIVPFSASGWERRIAPESSEEPPRTVVLIPAHNEAGSIGRTLASVRQNAGERVSMLVVADNCSDNTAAIARQSGAQVLERHDLRQRGKAYALGFGVQFLREDPPDVVVIVDADSLVGGRKLSHLASVAHRLQRPVQSLNLIDRRRTRSPHAVIQTLGNRFHNLVRPLGNAKLGAPCLLMGSGMAFPWRLVEQVGLQNDSLGEDKQLGVAMTLAGAAPFFYPFTKVASYVAEEYGAYVGQRTRWEHGHLLVAWSQIPRLIRAALTQRSLAPWIVAVDLWVPPLAVQALIMFTAASFAMLLYLWKHDSLPGILVSLAVAMNAYVFLITWRCFARNRVGWRDLFAVPGYIASKLPIYLRLLLQGPQRTWLRCERPKEREKRA